MNYSYRVQDNAEVLERAINERLGVKLYVRRSKAGWKNKSEKWIEEGKKEEHGRKGKMKTGKQDEKMTDS